jgi:hypothetical protein
MIARGALLALGNIDYCGRPFDPLQALKIAFCRRLETF